MSNIIYHLAAGQSHERAAARLHAALANLGFSAVEFADVYDLVIEHFNRDDFFFGRRLLEASDTLPWQAVYVGPGSDLRERYDASNVAQSQEVALGFLLEEIDLLRLEVSNAKFEQHLIEIHGPNGLIARVAPIGFEVSDATIVSRVERSLKGLQIYGQSDEIVRKLGTIPGLDCVIGREDRSEKIRGSVFIKTPTSFAAMLRRMLAQDLNIEVKQHQAQELIAIVFGASNWQQLIHHYGQDRCWCHPVSIVSHDGDDQKSESTRYFRNTAIALWEVGQMVKHWDGPRLNGEYTSVYGGVPYIHFGVGTNLARRIADGIDDGRVLSLVGHSVVAAHNQSYDDAASSILRAADPATAFKAYLGDDPIESANPRMGIAPANMKRFAGHVFTIRDIGGSETLFLERFGSTQKRLSEHSVAIESASIGIDPTTGGYCIYHDDPEVPLEGLSDADRDAVLNWAGIRIRHFSLIRFLTRDDRSVN